MGRDTLEQFTLVDMNEEDYISDDISTHKCKECKKFKPIHSFNTKNILPPQKKEGSFFPTRRQTHEGNVQLFTLDNICKKCGAKGRAGRHARGWLCNNCNTGLGAMGDNIEGLKKAMRYLEGDSNDS